MRTIHNTCRDVNVPYIRTNAIRLIISNKVFISYSRTDHVFEEWLALRLNQISSKDFESLVADLLIFHGFEINRLMTAVSLCAWIQDKLDIKYDQSKEN